MRKNSKFEIRNSKFIILAGIALVLIVAIYNQQQRQQEENFLLNPPPKEASRSVLKKHAQMVAALANEGTTLELKESCKPSTLVLKVEEGTEIKIINQDNHDRRIIIDSKHYYDIPKNGSKIIKAQFKYGTGDYGYVCEGVGIVGFLHVV